MYNNFPLFSNDPLSDYINSLFKQIEDSIYRQEENYILNVNEEDFFKYVKSKCTLEIPKLKIKDSYIEKDQKEVIASSSNCINKIKSKCLIIRYCIPIEGNEELLQYRPNYSHFSTGGPSRVFWDSKCIYAEFDNCNSPNSIRSSINKFQELLLSNIQSLYNQIEQDYTCKLDEFITKSFQDYKQKIKNNIDFVEAIGIPFKVNEHTPSTFSVPSPKTREKIIISRPTVKETKYQPEPTLDWTNFQKILKLINDIGKNFERCPSTSAGKQEEVLRDHILLTIDPNFVMGSASGETFNKTGKTDIQLRYNSSVVFIAECKIWAGEKNYLKTIDQLLKYLTWRDSKAAIIVFSKKKDFTNVLNKITEFTPQHPNFLSKNNLQDETWFNYKFHINGDRNRKIDLAILAFNIPEKEQ